MITKLRAPVMCLAGAALAVCGPQGLPAWICGGALFALGSLMLIGGE